MRGWGLRGGGRADERMGGNGGKEVWSTYRFVEDEELDLGAPGAHERPRDGDSLPLCPATRRDGDERKMR